MHVVGACVPGEMSDDVARRARRNRVPLLGDVDAILDSAQFIGADTVAVISSSLIGPEKLAVDFLAARRYQTCSWSFRLG